MGWGADGVPLYRIAGYFRRVFIFEVAIGPVTGSVFCGYRSGSLIYDTLRMSTWRFVDLEI